MKRAPQLAALALLLVATGCAGTQRSDYTPLTLARRAPGAPSALEPGITIAQAPSATMTIEDCVREAVRAQRRMRRARRAVEIASDRVREAWSRSLPRLEAGWQAASRTNDPGVRTGSLRFVGADRTIRTTQATAVVPLYEILAGAPLRKAARLGARITGYEAQATEQQLRFETQQACLRALAAERARQVTLRSVEVLEAELERTRDLERVGLVTTTDVLAVEVALARRRQMALRAGHEVALARAAVNRLLLRDLRAPLRLLDVGAPSPLPTGGLERMQEIAVRARPDLRALKERVEAARADLAYTRTRLGPRIDLVGGYRQTSDSHQLNDSWWEGAIQVRLPVFDGGLTWALIGRKGKELQQAIDLYEQHVDDAVLEVQQAWVELVDATEQLEIARRERELAARRLEVARRQHRAGLVPHQRVLEGEQELFAARMNEHRALYVQHMARSRLELATGSRLEEEGQHATATDGPRASD